jgi:hypothetical protein
VWRAGSGAIADSENGALAGGSVRTCCCEFKVHRISSLKSWVRTASQPPLRGESESASQRIRAMG